MSTLGQKPATTHVSTEKQTITGNGGTSYTLQQSVSQASDIEVYVNNTRQEPAVAYNASGTTLIMTGAVNASDNFYVIFQGKAIQTAGLPVDAAITASTMSLSETLSVTGATTLTGGISGATTLTGLITASAGVAIGGTGSANTLDDYEEGTWTPTNASSNHFHSTVTVTSANYTKIGRAVFLNFQINMASSSGNVGSDSYFSIGGLPFTLNSTAGGTASMATNFTTAGYVTGIITGISGDTTVYVNFSGVISGTVPRSNHVFGQFNYFTNE